MTDTRLKEYNEPLPPTYPIPKPGTTRHLKCDPEIGGEGCYAPSGLNPDQMLNV